MKSLSSKVALCHYESTIQSSTKSYSCHVWVGAYNCYLNMLNRLQKRVYFPTVSPQDTAFFFCLIVLWTSFLAFL